jgi:hypothetical protein
VLPADTSAKLFGAATLWGSSEDVSNEVASMEELNEGMGGIIAAFDREHDLSPGELSTRDAITRVKKRQDDARERLMTTTEAHSAFLNATVAASRRLGAAVIRGTTAAAADDG